MATYQQLLGKFAVGASNNNLAVGVSNLTLTAGDYYIAGYTSEATSQLCEHMQAIIRAIAGGSQDTATVVYSGTTGIVTITLKTAATLAFTADPALATLLGYTSTSYGSATSFVAERQPRYVWRPTRQQSGYLLNLTGAAWKPKSTSITGRSNDGTTWGVQGNLLYDLRAGWFCLTEAEVKTPIAGTSYADLQQFFVDVAHSTKPLRYYPDRTKNAVADVFECVWGDEKDESVGDWLSYSSRHIGSYNGLWDVEIPLMKKV